MALQNLAPFLLFSSSPAPSLVVLHVMGRPSQQSPPALPHSLGLPKPFSSLKAQCKHEISGAVFCLPRALCPPLGMSHPRAPMPGIQQVLSISWLTQVDSEPDSGHLTLIQCL